MINISEELEPYVDFSSEKEHTLIAVDLPDILKDKFEKFKKNMKNCF